MEWTKLKPEDQGLLLAAQQYQDDIEFVERYWTEAERPYEPPRRKGKQ